MKTSWAERRLRLRLADAAARGDRRATTQAERSALRPPGGGGRLRLPPAPEGGGPQSGGGRAVGYLAGARGRAVTGRGRAGGHLQALLAALGGVELRLELALLGGERRLLRRHLGHRLRLPPPQLRQLLGDARGRLLRLGGAELVGARLLLGDADLETRGRRSAPTPSRRAASVLLRAFLLALQLGVRLGSSFSTPSSCCAFRSLAPSSRFRSACPARASCAARAAALLLASPPIREPP